LGLEVCIQRLDDLFGFPAIDDIIGVFRPLLRLHFVTLCKFGRGTKAFFLESRDNPVVEMPLPVN
jgi:hypothetical protein